MRVIIELKLADAEGRGGEVLTGLGLHPSRWEPGKFSGSLLSRSMDDISPDLAVRRFFSALKDQGITPLRIFTQIHDQPLMVRGSVTRADVASIEACVSDLLDTDVGLEALADLRIAASLLDRPARPVVQSRQEITAMENTAHLEKEMYNRFVRSPFARTMSFGQWMGQKSGAKMAFESHDEKSSRLKVIELNREGYDVFITYTFPGPWQVWTKD